MSDEKQNLVNLTIDGKSISVPKGTTVYQAATQLGIDLPIFCYQDRMPPFGACRVCLVEVDKMPKLQTSCTLEATEGMVVKTRSENAIKGREGILEFLLINHPLDCPICDRGGECPLQEQTLKFGPGESRFFEEKRHFKKPLPLGPVLMLDRERCIVCARCTRFGDLVAGDHALEMIDRGYKTEVGTPDHAPVDSKFIGNTIMICPVGALTSQVYRFRARPWDNEPTSSTCSLCPVGCSLILDSRDGEIMRTRSRENKAVNDIWLCDKGWFGYEFTYHPERLKGPLVRHDDGNFRKASWDTALSLIVEKIKQAKPSGKLAGLGGDSLTTEENYLFQKLMRQGAGVDHVDHRVGEPLIPLAEEGLPPGLKMSIGDCENLTHAVLLGLDITEEFPVIWLRLKQAINKGAKVTFIGHYAPEVAKYFDQTILHAPGQEIEMLQKHLSSFHTENGAVFVGRQYLASPQRREILARLKKLNTRLNIMEGHGNSMGARLAGMRPDVGPLGEKIANPGLNSAQILETAAKNGWDFLYVAGANPALKFPAKLWKEAREKLGFLVVQDLFMTETAKQADVVLPTLTFIEKGGSFINIEGRVQTLLPGKEIPEHVYSDREIFIKLAQKLDLKFDVDPHFTAALNPGRVPVIHPEEISGSDATSHNREGLFATFSRTLFDRGVRMQHNPHVSQLVKEPFVRLHPQEGKKRGIQDGDAVKLSANGNAICAKIKWDQRVAPNTIVLPFGFPEIPVHELGANLFNGFEIEVSK